jgi:HAD superfamily hydrolase (TIGR01549 family)
MRPVEAVIFDWGNTLVDYPLETSTEQIAWLSKFLSATARQFGGAFQAEIERLVASEAALLQFNQELPDHAVRSFERRLRESLPLNFSSHVASVVERQLCERLFASARAVEGAPLVMAELCRTGLRVGIVSNTPWGTTPEQWRKELDNYHFVRSHCVAAVFCRDVGFRKPHPAAFLACMRKLQTVPERTLVVGDSMASDIAGARAAGCRSVWLNRRRSQNPSGQYFITSLPEVLTIVNGTEGHGAHGGARQPC